MGWLSNYGGAAVGGKRWLILVTFWLWLLSLPLGYTTGFALQEDPTCTADPPGESENISDSLAVCSGQTVTGEVGDTDSDDVYKVFVTIDQEITIKMTGTDGDADLYLYPPGSTNIYSDDLFVAFSNGFQNNESIEYTALAEGFYYIDVFAAGDEITTYSLSITLSGVSSETDVFHYIPFATNNLDSPPGAPTLDSIQNPDNEKSYQVTWNSVARAESFTLQEDDNTGFTSPRTVYFGPKTSWSTGNAPPGTYHYRVKSTNAAGDSPWSNIQSVIVQSLLETPQLEPINNPGGNNIYRVKWSAVPEVDFYTLEQDRNPNFPDPTAVYTGTQTTWAASNTDPGPYYYRVKASNSQVASPWSEGQVTVVLADSCQADPARETTNVEDARTVCNGQMVIEQVSALGNDLDDVFKILVSQGQKLTASLRGTGGDVDLYLYPPGTTDIHMDYPIEFSSGPGNREILRVVVKEGGFYYLDIFAFKGTTSYVLSIDLSAP